MKKTGRSVDPKYTILIVLYWIAVSAPFVWLPFWQGDSNGAVAKECVVWITVASIYIIFTANFFRNSPLAAIVMPAILPAVSLAQMAILTGLATLRFIFCGMSGVLFIISFNAVLLFEGTEDLEKKHRDMSHRRYLEYMRSFVWLVIYGVVGYLLWEINWHKNLTEKGTAAAGLFHLASVFILGLVMVCYAFNVRLNELESK